jgi:cytochrome b pre-mRNA-processing protein 3
VAGGDGSDGVRWLKRILGGRRAAEPYRPLYAAVVAQARAPRWYREGGVADTLDGRFDMLSTVLAVVLLRLETLGVAGQEPAARLAELFIADMDGQLRQQGMGDLVVGKHVGRMMAQLGGRLSALREAMATEGALAPALDRNIHRAPDAPPATRARLAQDVRALGERVGRLELPALLAGQLA